MPQEQPLVRIIEERIAHRDEVELHRFPFCGALPRIGEGVRTKNTYEDCDGGGTFFLYFHVTLIVWDLPAFSEVRVYVRRP